jgi:cytochrome c6
VRAGRAATSPGPPVPLGRLFGPNLDQLKPSKNVVLRQVTNGDGGMPAFGGRLTKAQIAAIAADVASSAGKK